MRRRVNGVFGLALLLAWGAAVGQDHQDRNLTWSWQALSVQGHSDEVELIFKAGIEPGWILYSSDFKSVEFGPRSAKLALNAGEGNVAVGALEAVGAASKTDKNFAGEFTYTYFSGAAELRQRVKVDSIGRINGVISGQTCFEENGLCTLFKEEFSVAVP